MRAATEMAKTPCSPATSSLLKNFGPGDLKVPYRWNTTNLYQAIQISSRQSAPPHSGEPGGHHVAAHHRPVPRLRPHRPAAARHHEPSCGDADGRLARGRPLRDRVRPARREPG